MLVANNADELFDLTLDYLLQNGKAYDNVAREVIGISLTLTDPSKNTMTNCKRRMSMRYAIMEHLWYNSKNHNVNAINKYAKFWNKVSDDGLTVNSNYGHCIHTKFGFDQWEFVKRTLKNNPNSRQAIMHIKEARDLVNNPTKDVNCTIALQFLLRDGKLHMITTMRSNDIWLGLPYDLFNFTCMQIQMAMELDVDVGNYIHNAGSLHLYQRDMEKIIEGGTTNESV